MRLDKYLAQMSAGTRSEVKKFIKSGRVFVNDILVQKPEYQVGQDDVVTLDGERLEYIEYEYFMMNKPPGYVCAVRDRVDQTVISLITDSRRKDLFPVGRLDKDTEGLLLITNDGALAHNLLAPKKHVWKTYLVCARGEVTREDRQQLESGVDIGEEKETLPARASVKKLDEGGNTWLELSIREGRYHQVKRMMAAVGKPVLYLKRLSMGPLVLDENLETGEYRRLTLEEIKQLKQEK